MQLNRFFGTLLVVFCSFSLQSHANFCREVFYSPQIATMPQRAQAPLLPQGLELTDFPENTTSRIFVEYAVRNLLLSQSERDLAVRGLLVANGGLCATSSLTNVIGSMMAQEDNFKHVFDIAPQATEQIIQWYNEATGLDARLGANVSQLTNIVASRWQDLQTSYRFNSEFNDVSVSVERFQMAFYPYRMVRYFRGDSIGIMVVKPIEGPYQSNSYHAIVLLKVDVENRRLIFSDPNKANHIVSAPFEYTHGTDIMFQVPFTFGSDRVEIVSLDVLKRHIHESN